MKSNLGKGRPRRTWLNQIKGVQSATCKRTRLTGVYENTDTNAINERSRLGEQPVEVHSLLPLQ